MQNVRKRNHTKNEKHAIITNHNRSHHIKLYQVHISFCFHCAHSIVHSMLYLVPHVYFMWCIIPFWVFLCALFFHYRFFKTAKTWTEKNGDERKENDEIVMEVRSLIVDSDSEINRCDCLCIYRNAWEELDARIHYLLLGFCVVSICCEIYCFLFIDQKLFQWMYANVRSSESIYRISSINIMQRWTRDYPISSTLLCWAVKRWWSVNKKKKTTI